MGRWSLHLRAGGCALIASTDMGFLLQRTSHVLVRSSERPTVLAAERLIAWRTLQIVVGTPFLPQLRELRTLYPGLRVGQGRIALPLGLGGGEAALALCARAGVPVSATWIEYAAAGSG
jgi:hypothetical protein